MQNFSDDAHVQTEEDLALQTYFKTGISPDDVSAVFPLKRAQPVLQAFTALFHGGFNGVLLRLLVLRELTADVETPSLSRADINAKLGYLEPDALETVVAPAFNRPAGVGCEPVGVSHHANRAQCAGRHRIAAACGRK
jgi:hypothetical protein